MTEELADSEELRATRLADRTIFSWVIKMLVDGADHATRERIYITLNAIASVTDEMNSALPAGISFEEEVTHLTNERARTFLEFLKSPLPGG